MHIDRRKNDTVRKGHYPALGRSKDPALDIVAQLWTWQRRGCGSPGWQFIGPAPSGPDLLASAVAPAAEARAWVGIGSRRTRLRDGGR